jgi:hypothetical protein
MQQVLSTAGLLEYGREDVTYAHGFPNCTMTRKELIIEKLGGNTCTR